MDIRQVVHITLADQAPKIIDGYWHEWVNGEWIDSGVKAEAVDGKGVSILGSKGDPYQLPETGNELGDAYLIDGYLWVYDGSTTLTEATDGWNNVGKIEGPRGPKGNDGEDGKDAVAPIIIDDEWAFWNNTTLEFVKSGFSSIGDDGHSPEVREGYWWEWYPPINDYRNTGIKAEGKDGIDGIDGNPGADGTDGENAKTIKLTADSEVVKVNSDGSVTPSRIRVDYKATNTAVEYKEFYKNGVLVSEPTWIQDEASKNFFEIYTDDSGALFETFTIKLLDDIGNSDSITITRVKDGSDAFKYLIFGWWDENINYQISDLGIPVVKIEESVQGGFSARKLISDNYTYNESTGKGQFIESEWERVETVEFLYMQEAYIEKLQATLITAEKIEVLNLTHPSGLFSLIDGKLKVKEAEVKGKIESKEGEIGGFNISNSGLTNFFAYNTRIGPGNTLVTVTGDIHINSTGIIISSSYGNTTEHPQKVEWEAKITSSGIKVGEMEVRIDGIYRDGQKIL